MVKNERNPDSTAEAAPFCDSAVVVAKRPEFSGVQIRTFLFLVALFCSLLMPAAAQVNRADQIDKPYVILVSCDGYRYDYVERFRPPNISRFVEEGVQAASMISSFPSKTFPNHYTIATGLYPENHGLVNNSFYDPERGKEYRIHNRDAVEDGSWYGGTPIWVNAEKNGMVAASYFFVGSEAEIQGVRPSYYYQYKGSVPNEERVDQVLNWLQLPEEKRPHFISLYFSTMDDAGHRYGPGNEEQIGAALMKLDTVLGRLFDGVAATGLPVNIIIVSDHGMIDVGPEQLVNIDPLKQDDQYMIVNNGALAHVYLKDNADPQAVFQFLKSKEDHFTVYRSEEFPEYRYSKNKRLGDFILLIEYGYYFSDTRRIGMARSGNFRQGGEHGFDPEFPEMHAIFYAKGPALKKGITIPSFRNVHIYPLMCRILGLPIPGGIDGKPEVLQHILED
jgi:predicted AlkP superfamily pyrophosphatase or phosphodiesterase